MSGTDSIVRVRQKIYKKNKSQSQSKSPHWQEFHEFSKSHHFGTISNIHFSASKPFNFVINCSSRIKLFDVTGQNLIKEFTRFKDVMYSATLRQDGKLVVAGSENKSISIADCATGRLLRQFRGHREAVHVTGFCSDNTHIYSGSNDHTVRRWNIPSKGLVDTLEGHTDYIRCISEDPGMPSTLYSGSYDHHIKQWDLRTGSCVKTFDHGSPVEDLLLMPSGNLLISAGSNVIKVWDLLRGEQCIQFSNHQKAITSLCLAKNASKSWLLSSSLDGHINIYDTSSYEVVHKVQYAQPVMSVAVSPDNNFLCTGFTDGTLGIRKRFQKKEENEKKKRKGRMVFYHNRGVTGKFQKSNEGDYVISRNRMPKLNKWDKCLKKFEYREALDHAFANWIDSKKKQNWVIAVMEELVDRGALTRALRDRDDAYVNQILTYLIRYIMSPEWSAFLIDVAKIVLNVYSEELGKPQFTKNLTQLRVVVEREMNVQKICTRIVGSLDLIMAAFPTASKFQPLLLEQNLELKSQLQVVSSQEKMEGKGGEGKEDEKEDKSEEGTEDEAISNSLPSRLSSPMLSSQMNKKMTEKKIIMTQSISNATVSSLASSSPKKQKK